MSFVSISFNHFLAKSVKIRGLLHLLAECHAEMFAIDAHAVLTERLGKQCLLYRPFKIINFSDKLRIIRFYNALILPENSF